MGSKKKTTKAIATETTESTTGETAVVESTFSTSAPPVAGPTLHDVCVRYLKHMDKTGKSTGTISSYTMELRLAQEEIGEDTPLAELTPEKVATYFACKRVTKLKSGRAKSKLSIDKTTRVLWLALVHAADKGLIERAPLPEKSEAS